jgi:hypothetical protein
MPSGVLFLGGMEYLGYPSGRDIEHCGTIFFQPLAINLRFALCSVARGKPGNYKEKHE